MTIAHSVIFLVLGLSYSVLGFLIENKTERHDKNGNYDIFPNIKRQDDSGGVTLSIASATPKSIVTSTNPVVQTTSYNEESGIVNLQSLSNSINIGSISKGILIKTSNVAKSKLESITRSTTLIISSSLVTEFETIDIKTIDKREVNENTPKIFQGNEETKYPNIYKRANSKSKSYVASVSYEVIYSESNKYTGNLLEPISINNLSSIFPLQQLPILIPDGVSQDSIIPTNKFYTNILLGNQTEMIWAFPYGLNWMKEIYYGIAIQHTIPAYRLQGIVDTNNPTVESFYSNPVKSGEIVLSAESFDMTNSGMNVTNMTHMSTLARLYSKLNPSVDYVDFPIVQGMGYVTAIYHGGLVPQIHSITGISSVVKISSDELNSNTLKYRITLVNGVEYLLYAIVPEGNDFQFAGGDSNSLIGSNAIEGLIIQLAVAPSSQYYDQYYNEAAGIYTTDAELVAESIKGEYSVYGFKYNLEGSSKSGKPILFVLPHHISSLTNSTNSTYTGLIIPSTTKGNMYGYLTDSIMMNETFNKNVQFLPWTTDINSDPIFYTPNQLRKIAGAINEELAVDIKTELISIKSNYFAGKVLDKYAYILLVLCDIINDEALTKSTLSILKDAFSIYITNKQYYPYIYDTKFGGITSSAYENGGALADFGSSYYNDHHFHYGYFVHAAAVIGYVDSKFGGTWIKKNKMWVNSLIRDVANPSTEDEYFPQFRMFDWFHGHSWASGLFESADGRNEESSSEDYNFAYGMKLWGKVSKDKAMELRGDLMLAVMSRSMNLYFLYSTDNTVEPSNYTGNKVSGILYENKINYGTFFGHPNYNPEYVHGIHMLPITPASSLIRKSDFVQDEWNDQIKYWMNEVESGWAGILRLNQALFDPYNAYGNFSSSNWSPDRLDDGQSLSWCLAFTAALSNCKI